MVTTCAKVWRWVQPTLHVCHHLEPNTSYKACRAHFCTALLLQLQSIMYAWHLATLTLKYCRQGKLPPLNNVLNAKEHEQSYGRKFSLLQANSATKSIFLNSFFFFSIRHFWFKKLYKVILWRVWTAGLAFLLILLQHSNESFLFSYIPFFLAWSKIIALAWQQSTSSKVWIRAHGCCLFVSTCTEVHGFRDVNTDLISAKHHF